jgi:DNA-3-methyladenine glycosylase II
MESSRERSITIQTAFSDITSAATTYLNEIDSVMSSTIERVGPCTLTPNPNIFNVLVNVIISQQVSMKAADAILACVQQERAEVGRYRANCAKVLSSLAN